MSRVITIAAIAGCIIMSLIPCQVTDTERQLAELRSRCEQLEQRCKYYDNVMVTYQFFNEHWTATMCGEGGR